MSKKEYEVKKLYAYLSEEKLISQKDFLGKMVPLKKMVPTKEQEYVLIDGMESLIKERFIYDKYDIITKTQMRNIFEIVQEGYKNITTKGDCSTIAKVNVKLIYMAGKIDKKDVKDFIILLLDILKKNYDFGNDFIESALAYHKFHARN